MNNQHTNVILYCRVSTDDQALGFSLMNQENTLKSYCKNNNYNILETYLEDESAKDFNRPEWSKMEKYVKANKKQVDKVLFVKWDRFSRNTTLSHAKVDLFHLTYGVELNACEQPLDLSIPENLLMLSTYLAMSEIERRRISLRTLGGNHTSKQLGYYPHKSCYGYKNIKIFEQGRKKGRGTLEIVESQAKFVREAFQEVAKGLIPPDTIRKNLLIKGFKMGSSNFYEMLSKIVYMGKVLVPEHKGEDAYLNDAIHEAIIDEQLFYKTQNVLLGNKLPHKKPSNKNIHLPLRGHLVCDECEKNLTGSVSTSRTVPHPYYHCRNGCKMRVNGDNAAFMFNSLLEELKINENVHSLYKHILVDTIKTKEGDKGATIKKKLKEKDKMMQNIYEIEDRLATKDIAPESFNSMNNRYQSKIRTINNDVENLNTKYEALEDKVEGAMNVLLNLPKLYSNAEFEGKQLILGSMFPNKLILSKNNCRTIGINKVVDSITRNNKASGSLKKRKAVNNDSFSALVPEAGIEPALPKELDFESSASTSSATRASFCRVVEFILSLLKGHSGNLVGCENIE
jgi:site-specific DNA recombinase